jgi:hypothetical protein
MVQIPDFNKVPLLTANYKKRFDTFLSEIDRDLLSTQPHAVHITRVVGKRNPRIQHLTTEQSSLVESFHKELRALLGSKTMNTETGQVRISTGVFRINMTNGMSRAGYDSMGHFNAHLMALVNRYSPRVVYEAFHRLTTHADTGERFFCQAAAVQASGAYDHLRPGNVTADATMPTAATAATAAAPIVLSGDEQSSTDDESSSDNAGTDGESDDNGGDVDPDDANAAAASSMSPDQVRESCAELSSAFRFAGAAVDLSRVVLPVIGLVEATLFVELQKDFKAGLTGTNWDKMAVAWNDDWIPVMAEAGKRVNFKTAKHLSDFGKKLLQGGATLTNMRDTLGKDLLQDLKELRRKFGQRSTTERPSHLPVRITRPDNGAPAVQATIIAPATAATATATTTLVATQPEITPIVPQSTPSAEQQPARKRSRGVSQDLCSHCGRRYDDAPHRSMADIDRDISLEYSDADACALSRAWPTDPGVDGGTTKRIVDFPHVPGARSVNQAFCPWKHNILWEWSKRQMKAGGGGDVAFVGRVRQSLVKARQRARSDEGDTAE